MRTYAHNRNGCGQTSTVSFHSVYSVSNAHMCASSHVLIIGDSNMNRTRLQKANADCRIVIQHEAVRCWYLICPCYNIIRSPGYLLYTLSWGRSTWKVRHWSVSRYPINNEHSPLDRTRDSSLISWLKLNPMLQGNKPEQATGELNTYYDEWYWMVCHDFCAHTKTKQYTCEYAKKIRFALKISSAYST